MSDLLVLLRAALEVVGLVTIAAATIVTVLARARRRGPSDPIRDREVAAILVDAAIHCGQVEPHRRDWGIALAMRDSTAFFDYCDEPAPRPRHAAHAGRMN